MTCIIRCDVNENETKFKISQHVADDTFLNDNLYMQSGCLQSNYAKISVIMVTT